MTQLMNSRFYTHKSLSYKNNRLFKYNMVLNVASYKYS